MNIHSPSGQDDLLSKIKLSDSKDIVESDVSSILKEATDILILAKKSGNDEIYKNFLKNYEKLKSSITESLVSSNNINDVEMIKLKLEFSDMISWAKENNIIENDEYIVGLSMFISGKSDDPSMQREVESFLKKDIKHYSKSEAIGALEYLNQKYSQYSGANVLEKIVVGINGDDSLSELANTTDVNVYQEELINNILGNNKGYNDTLIIGYNEKKGNHLIKIADYKKKINNGEDLGRESTATFVLYLSEKFPNKKDFLKELNNIFGDNTNKIAEFINGGESKRISKARNILEKYGVIKGGKLIYDFFSGIFEKFKKMLSNLDFFFEKINNMDEEEAKMLLQNLKEKGSILKLELRKTLLNELGETENKEEIAEELLNKIVDTLEKGKYGNIYTLIHNAGLKDIPTIAAKSFSVGENMKKISYVNAFIEGDKSKLEKARSTLIHVNEHKIIAKEITNEEAVEIAELVSSGENFDKIMLELCRKNKKLRTRITKHRKKYKKHYEKQEENQETDTNKDKNSINETSNNSSTNIITDNYLYNFNSGNLYIDTNNGTSQKILLSNEEKELVKNNPENLKNIVDFFIVLDEVGLSNLWAIKEEIFTSISNVQGVGFNIKDGYLNENETKIFLNAILVSCGEKELSIINSLKGFIKKVEIINGVNSSGNENDVNSYGESKLENTFRKKYLTKGPVINLKHKEFEESIK